MAAKKGEQKINRQFILDHMYEGEVDLSMCSLSQVPVKELALVSRGTRLDLSRNLFITLPDNFGTLKHLIELDLSSNQLTALPESISQLVLLQKLDLYSNKLTTLPLMFWQLKKLKWLDLRSNSLEPGLAEAAGPCVNEAECKQCASKVLVLMKQRSAEHERKRQLELKRKREEESRLAEEERQRQEEAKRQKAELRQRKREEHARLEQEKALLAKQKEEEEEAEFIKNEQAIGDQEKDTQARRSCCSTLCIMLATVVFLLLLLLFGSFVLCDQLKSPAQVCSYWREYVLGLAEVTKRKDWTEQIMQFIGLS